MIANTNAGTSQTHWTKSSTWAAGKNTKLSLIDRLMHHITNFPRALGDYLNCHEEIKESQIRSNCKDAAAAEYHLNIISPVVLKSKPFAERYCFEKMKPSHRQWYVISASAATGVTSVFSVMVAAFIVALL